MGLVARVLEAGGIATVALGVVRRMIVDLPAPRNALVRFPLGQVFGPPGAKDRQRAVLRAALGLTQRALPIGAIVELPYKWKREATP